MGRKNKKVCHCASRAIVRSSEAEKRGILELYARLDGKERPARPEIPFELAGTVEKRADIGSLIEQLMTGSADLLIDALNKLGRMADTNGADLSKALPLVLRILKSNPDEPVRYEATKVISKIKNGRAAEDLIYVIGRDPSEKVKEGAVKALGLIRAEGCFAYLSGLLNDIWNQSIRVRRAAAFAIGRLDPKTSVNILCDSLVNDPDAEVRCEAAESMAICLLKLEKNQAGLIVQAVSSQLDFEVEQAHEVRIAVINAVTVTENSNCIDELIATLKKDPHPRVRGQAAHALAHFFDPRIEKALIQSLDREVDGAKKRIALALAYYAMKNPLGLHDEICDALIKVQKIYPRYSYIWKEAVKALPAC